LRFLIPTGFMPEGDGIALRVSMCSSQGKSEQVEIPGEPAKPHCDHCTGPTLGAPLAPFNFAGLLPVPQNSLLPLQESRIPGVSLVRAQLPRAPPAA
jgi:hypothetical protein